jgi:hypothetical protein
MRTHSTKRTKTWAALDVIQTALDADCTRAAFTTGLTRLPGDAAIPVEQRDTPVYCKCRRGGSDGERGRQRVSRGVSKRLKLPVSLVCEKRPRPITTAGIAELGRQRAQSAGFRDACQSSLCASSQGTDPPAAADCFALWHGTDALSALSPAIDPFHAVVPVKYKLEFPKPRALAMHPSYTANHR